MIVMQTGRWMVVAVLLVAGVSVGRAGDLAIQSFDRTGRLTFNEVSAVPPGGWTDEHKITKLVMRRIPATTPDFTMGSPSNEQGREPLDAGSETQHPVTLTEDFYIGVFEVTQKQWERVMDARPGYFTNATCRDSRPVEQVSAYHIRENPTNSAISPNWPESSQVHEDSFMGKLRAKTGIAGFDLPTESQWEYACRAGTGTALNSGKNLTALDICPNMLEVGRYSYNGGSDFSEGGDTSGGTAKVGSYRPNPWGLYDMHGNVWEWCLDWYAETYPETGTDPEGAPSGLSRVFRGGSWGDEARFCRSADRYDSEPEYVNFDVGFRACCDLPGQP